MSGRLYKRCCVPNCENTRDNNMILHVFPNPAKDRVRFQTWVQAVGPNIGELDEMAVFKHRRICHSHFEPKYYTISKRLSSNAVPTLNLQVSPELPDLACHCCLATERELHSVTANVLEAYKSIVGNSIARDSRLSICVYCRAVLSKFVKFRSSCLRTQRVLEDAKDGNERITTERLKLDNVHLQYEQTKIRLFSVNCIGQITFDNLTYEHHDDPLDVPQHDADVHTHDASESFNEDRIDDSNEKPRISNLEPKSSVAKKEKSIESIDNMAKFERDYDVAISILSVDQQMQDVLDRRLSKNYLQSPYRCDLCYKGFVDEDTLNKHVRTQHDVNRKVVCDYCNFRYRDRRALNQHLKSHRLKFSCRQCRYVSRTTFNAREHYKMHGGRLHQCADCGKSYEKLTSYLSHMRIHHPSMYVWCNICGEAFVREFGLNTHKKRAHRDLSLLHRCARCDKHFASQPALDRHALVPGCASDGQASCVHCGDVFEERLHLRDHLLHHHRLMKIYTCEKCGKTFKRQSLYSAHYRLKHVAGKRESPRLWVCEVCGKTLPNKCLLVYHQRNHTGERPYKCSQCPKSFTLKKLLQSHLRVHSSARPYACSLCPKTFKGLSALRGHEHMHSQGRVRSEKRGDRRSVE